MAPDEEAQGGDIEQQVCMFRPRAKCGRTSVDFCVKLLEQFGNGMRPGRAEEPFELRANQVAKLLPLRDMRSRFIEGYEARVITQAEKATHFPAYCGTAVVD